MQRTFSYSAPPPRLVPPQMPSSATPLSPPIHSPDSDRHDDDETTETSDYNSDTEHSAEYPFINQYNN